MHKARIKFLIAIACVVLATGRSGAQTSDAPEKYVEIANNCESNIARLDNIHSMADKEGLIIAIARLGNGEWRSDLNRRRLHNLKLWLKEIRGREMKTIITAEGERVRGRGRIEIYIRGKLVDVLGLGKGEDLAVGSCDGTGAIDHLYYGSRRRRSE